MARNLKILRGVADASGAKVLLALKAFSMFSLAPLLDRYLDGICASGLYEARLGSTEFGGEVHTYSPAYKAADLAEILRISHHVVFNSLAQWQRFQSLIAETFPNNSRTARPKFGLRVNPLHSEGAAPLYDPCAEGSRLGIPLPQLAAANTRGDSLAGISGLHFHTLCEQNFAPLSRTLDVVESGLARLLPGLQWINFGGGHHITRNDYQVEALSRRIIDFQQRHQLQVYLEPGEAVAINTGVLVSEVLDLGHNGVNFAILDTSATCHMPDTLEMPYRADIFGAGDAGEKPHTYRLGGQTCLAGDVMGDYSFAQPLRVGQRLMFDDMAHYTMVKTSTFNGLPLPALAIWNSATDALRIVREFSYADFRDRLS